MNNREQAIAILNYRNYSKLPIVHFGFWQETLHKWHKEGHLEEEEAIKWADGNEFDRRISTKLGFDFNWYSCYHANTSLFPSFENKVIEDLPDGGRKVLNSDGVTILEKEGAISIPMEIDHILKDRTGWEEFYLPKLQFVEERINYRSLEMIKNQADRDIPLGIYIGSLYGNIRNWMGIEGLSYLYADDEELYSEIINTVGDLCYKVTEKILSIVVKLGINFDFGHFWEDICFKTGPLVSPAIFAEKVGPHYRKITDLLNKYGINIVSLDCDGKIDALIPTWIENGVNTMFPIEVGTWGANIRPWRVKYGKELRGVGGMDKKVFAYDYSAVDIEIERLKPLVELGGYIPCPDHRIAPDAKWENVQYYCEKMNTVFS